MTKLRPKQQRFVQEYLVDLNATKAAIRAGYSEKTAGSQGFDLLKKPEIELAVQQAFEDVAQRVGVTQQMVIKEYVRLAFSDLSDVVDVSSGEVVVHNLNELSEDVRRAVSEVSSSVTPSGINMRVKLHDKKGALDSLAKYLGLLKDNNDKGTNVQVNVAQIVKVVYEDGEPNGDIVEA